jgi:hypothetical protein
MLPCRGQEAPQRALKKVLRRVPYPVNSRLLIGWIGYRGRWFACEQMDLVPRASVDY